MGRLGSRQRAQLQKVFGDRVSFRRTERVLYAHDIAALPSLLRPLLGNCVPDAVVQPESEAELVELVRWASAGGVPLTPRGKASSGYGGVLPIKRGVVVDFHPNWQVAACAPEKITSSLDHPLFQAYGQMLARTARLLKPLSGERIALELMNEPQWGWDAASTARWARMQKIWHDLARAEAPDLAIVLSGARGGDLEGMLALDATIYGASNVLWRRSKQQVVGSHTVESPVLDNGCRSSSERISCCR